jgi:hypothetical protein
VSHEILLRFHSEFPRERASEFSTRGWQVPVVFMVIRITTRTCKLIESMQYAGDMYSSTAQQQFEG